MFYQNILWKTTITATITIIINKKKKNTQGLKKNTSKLSSLSNSSFFSTGNKTKEDEKSIFFEESRQAIKFKNSNSNDKEISKDVSNSNDNS